jgi:hypothetical protein
VFKQHLPPVKSKQGSSSVTRGHIVGFIRLLAILLSIVVVVLRRFLCCDRGVLNLYMRSGAINSGLANKNSNLLGKDPNPKRALHHVTYVVVVVVVVVVAHDTSNQTIIGNGWNSMSMA